VKEVLILEAINKHLITQAIDESLKNRVFDLLE